MKLITIGFVALFTTLAQAQVSSGIQANFSSEKFLYLTGVLTSSSKTTNSVAGWNAGRPPKWYSLAVTTTASSWTAVLEGSLDNANWSTIAVTNSAIGQIANQSPIPALYMRARAVVIGANAQITATAVGTW